MDNDKDMQPKQDINASTTIAGAMKPDLKGSMRVSDYGSLKIHTYVSPQESWLVTTQIIEGPEKLVVFDGLLLNPFASEVAMYIRSYKTYEELKKFSIGHIIVSSIHFRTGSVRYCRYRSERQSTLVLAHLLHVDLRRHGCGPGRSADDD